MSAWAWMAQAYDRPRVMDACLTLQDDHGHCVPFLLWAAWAKPDDEALVTAAGMARTWETQVLASLRQARRALKTPSPGLDDAGRLALRTNVIAAERQAERLLTNALGGQPREGDLEAALDRAGRAWGASSAGLAVLAAALG